MPESLPPDDPTVADDEMLYRRIFPDHIIQTSVPGQFRPNSGALKDDSGPLSVDRGSLSTPQQTRDRDTSYRFHVAGFTAGTARKYGCRIIPDPEPNNPAHAKVYGNHQNGNGALVYKSQARKIAHDAVVVLMNEP